MKSYGHLDCASENLIGGWAIIEDLNIIPEIIIFGDNQEIGRISASLFRPDLLEKKIHPTGYCGFDIRNFDKTNFNQATVIKAIISQTGMELTNSPYYLKDNKMSDFPAPVDDFFVFLHIPKTAGTSFRYAAEKVFGHQAVIIDYGIDNPVTSPLFLNSFYQNRKDLLVSQIRQNNIKFIMGHFHVVKYLDIFDKYVKWCTFLREPIARVISEYNYLIRNNFYDKSLVEFCNDPNQCNRQSQLISGLKLEDFYFVGITEYYQKSIQKFNQLSRLNFDYLEENLGRINIDDSYNIEPEIIQMIRNNNLKDISLYKKALSLI